VYVHLDHNTAGLVKVTNAGCCYIFVMEYSSLSLYCIARSFLLSMIIYIVLSTTLLIICVVFNWYYIELNKDIQFVITFSPIYFVFELLISIISIQNWIVTSVSK
jgi:hypothetical protein